MKAVILTIGLVLLAAVAQAQTFTLGQPLTAVWNPSLNEADAAISVYQVRVDAEPWVGNGQSVPQSEYRYAIPQALLTVGPHSVSVRGCMGGTCGDAATITITVARPLPGIPQAPRVVPSQGAPLALDRAIELAQSYAYLALERRLTAPELATIAAQHGPRVPTRESVFAVLDASYAGLVP
jgi:hypothetical protein